MNKRYIILRFLASPFILGMLLITYNYHCIRQFIYVLRYGGEWQTYSKDTKKNIGDIFKLLENQSNEQRKTTQNP